MRLILLTVLLLTACAPTRQYATEEVTADRYLHRREKIQEPMATALETYTRSLEGCGVSGPRFNVRSKLGLANVVVRTNFAMFPNTTLAVVELREVDGGTVIETFTPHDGWRNFLDTVISQLRGERACYQWASAD